MTFSVAMKMEEEFQKNKEGEWCLLVKIIENRF